MATKVLHLCTKIRVVFFRYMLVILLIEILVCFLRIILLICGPKREENQQIHLCDIHFANIVLLMMMAMMVLVLLLLSVT